jgi:hypothetical protein
LRFHSARRSIRFGAGSIQEDLMFCERVVHSGIASIALLAALAVAGCTTVQAKDATPSGFLGDYSQLQKGGDDQALLVYVDHSANWKQYTKIKFDPVTIYANEQLKDVSPEQLQTLANYLDATVREHLKNDYQFVEETGPDVMRLRMAITQAEGSSVVLDTLSTIVPIGRVITEAKLLAFGTGSFAGSAGCECEMLDSTTGTRLCAAVDRRIGRKSVKGVFGKWSDVENAYDEWAEKLQVRLGDFRAGRP